MILRPCLPLLVALLIPVGAAAAPQLWQFDPLHTQITFFVDHQGFSHAAGRLHVKDGWFQFDPDDWSGARVDVRIDLASLDMGDPQWSDTVRSAQFLDAGRYPFARFTSGSVEKTGDRTGIVHGQLNLHGTNLPLDLAVTFNRLGTDPYAFRSKIGFSATTSIARAAFGIKRYQGVVGDAVQVRIEVEGVKLKSDPATGKNPKGAAP